jgi:hypothetical protein
VNLRCSSRRWRSSAATITLPGLAGLALTVGMSVDNNVLINERIREELRAGKSFRAAVDAGYNHAFTAIFDGHVTTFISGVVLLQYGTGPVKGFAVTLLIGIIANLFTGVFATRVVFDWLVRGLRVKHLLGNDAMEVIISRGRVYDFMSIRKYWIAFSIILSVLSADPAVEARAPLRHRLPRRHRAHGAVRGAGDTGRIRDTLERMGTSAPRWCRRTSRPNEYILRVEKTSALSGGAGDAIQRSVEDDLRRDTPTAPSGSFASRPAATTSSCSSRTGAPRRAPRGHAAPRGRRQRARRRGPAGRRRRRAPLAGAPGGHRRPDLRAARRPATEGGVGVEGRLNASVWVSPKAGRELRDAAIGGALLDRVHHDLRGVPLRPALRAGGHPRAHPRRAGDARASSWSPARRSPSPRWPPSSRWSATR